MRFKTDVNKPEVYDGLSIKHEWRGYLPKFGKHAYKKALPSIRATIQPITLFILAVSVALGEILIGLSGDPLLVWNYGFVAVVAIFDSIE